MNAWLTTQIGAEAANIVSYVALIVAAIIVLWLIILIIKRLARGTYVVGGKGREARLSVRDAAPIDSKRRLVLIKRDNVEHLILIGGPTDLVIETNISKFPLSSHGSDEVLGLDTIEGERNQVISNIFPATTSTIPMAASAPVQSSVITQENHNFSGFDSINPNTVSNIGQLQANTLTDDVTNVNDSSSPIPRVARATPPDSNKTSDVATYRDDKIEEPSSSGYTNDTVEETSSISYSEEGKSFEAEEIVSDDNNSADSHSRNADFEAGSIVHDDQLHNDEPQETDLEATPKQVFASDEAMINKSPIKNHFDKTDTVTNETGISVTSLGSLRTIKVKDNKNISETNGFTKLNDSIPQESANSGYSSLQGELNQPANQENSNKTTKQVLRSESPHQQAQDNLFGTPKPINPYKVMKAAGVFRGSNVNFNATISNAPVNKSNTSSEKSKPLSTNDDRFITQQGRVATGSLNKVETPFSVENTIEPSKDTTPTLAKATNTTTTTKDTQSPKQVRQEEARTDVNTIALNSQKESLDIPNDSGTPNPSNKVPLANQRPTGFLPADKVRPAQERPIAQRSVPQGMLRPPLMAKPRNAAVTSVDNQLKQVSGLDAALDNATKLSQALPTTKIAESNNQTVVPSNAARKLEQRRDTVAENRGILVENNVPTDERQKVDEKQQEAKDTVKNKNANLQKFSLQLLEPQHILDKPSRNEQNGANKVRQNAIDTADEEEFDRRLKNELDQSARK